jgi:tetratricopeptide (TPR) repeat protein
MAADDDATVAETPRAEQRRKAPTDPPPERYKLLGQIGEGGMGRVYRAHDTRLGRDVALKLIESDQVHGPDRTEQRVRFVREARAAARLLHPNIAVVHDVDPDAGWLVMELVEGESLRAVAERGPLAPQRVAKIAAQVLAALDAAHAAGIIHRDIKPSNIMLCADDRVKLVDFGVARLVDVDVTRTGDQVGTPAYMAPEQVRGGPVDARTDLYGLGATLYELVTGERMVAFESPGPAALAKLHAACGRAPELERVIARCLQGEPSARFSSARDALIALSPTTRGARRWLAIAIAACVLLIAGTVAGVVALVHRGHVDPRVEKSFALAQRGENEKALQILQAYLVEHPGDIDAWTINYLAGWWQGMIMDDITAKATALPLRPAQRAMISGIGLIGARRENEAIAFLEAALHDTPDAVEILYALGEAQWHGGHLEDGVATLEHAFTIDPRWQMALHHVEEFRLGSGAADKLVPIADRLRAVDPASAAALDCKIAVGRRDYAGAVTGAKAALARTDLEKIPELYICLAQAQAVLGDLDGATATARRAFDLWPIDYREWGGFAQYAELMLYRGKLDDYLTFVGGKSSRQRTIALLFLRPDTPTKETPPNGPGMREPPLGAATWLLQQQQAGHDEVEVYSKYPEPEVRAWGAALAAEAKGDTATAIARLREGLAAPQKGDIRMLLAHRLAKLLYATGDAAGAKAACEEVVTPRLYINYRAVLLPDCLRWQ